MQKKSLGSNRSRGKTFVVHGSPTLVRSLMRDGLVDEYHFLVYPPVLGSGKRMFADGTDAELKLGDSKTFGTVVVAQTYQPCGQWLTRSPGPFVAWVISDHRHGSIKPIIQSV